MVDSTLRVLIVDDHEDAADSLAMLATLWGHDVRVAYNGREALACLSDFAPHVALLDLVLPGMNGVQIADALRQNPSGKDTVIIGISGHPQVAQQEYSASMRLDDYFLKPIAVKELKQVLRAERTRLEREGKLAPPNADGMEADGDQGLSNLP